MDNDKATQWLTKAGGVARRWEQARGDRPALVLARELGWSSSKVTRIEQGTQVPSRKDVEDWARICGLSKADKDGLATALDEFVAIRPILKQRARKGAASVPTDASALVETATLIRTYSTWAVPPILQLEEYAVAVLNEQERLNPGVAPDLIDALAGRMRRQNLLFDKTRRFEILLDESVLYRRHGGADILRDQLDWLLPRAVAPKPSAKAKWNLRFGIVPFGAVVGAPAVQSLALYDEQAFVEGIEGDVPAGPIQLELSTRLLDQLWVGAAEGDKARQLILKAMAAVNA